MRLPFLSFVFLVSLLIASPSSAKNSWLPPQPTSVFETAMGQSYGYFLMANMQLNSDSEVKAYIAGYQDGYHGKKLTPAR